MITKSEQLRRKENVKQALAIVRLEGQNPGPHTLAVYDDYIVGKFDLKTCKEKIFKAAIQDLKDLSN